MSTPSDLRTKQPRTSAAVRILALLLVLVSFAVAQKPKSSGSTSKTVHVRQYTRKDGTVVSAYDRRAPGTASKTAPSKVPTTTNTKKQPGGTPAHAAGKGTSTTNPSGSKAKSTASTKSVAAR